jgi:hypothetical protein
VDKNKACLGVKTSAGRGQPAMITQFPHIIKQLAQQFAQAPEINANHIRKIFGKRVSSTCHFANYVQEEHKTTCIPSITV